MKPDHLLSPLQRAWLDEMGADVHWLDPRTPAAGPSRAQVAGGQSAQSPAVPAGPADPVAPSPVTGGGPSAARQLSGRLQPDPQRRPGPMPGVAKQGPALRPAATSRAFGPASPQSSGPAVPGGGVSSRPLYFIVGEQPGIEDDAAGKPFQGDSGRLLKAMMAAARLPDPESAYLTYVVKHRTVGGRVPGAQDIAAGLVELQQEIVRVQPHWILALGKTAAQAILGVTDDLDALRGRPHTWSGADGTMIPVWVTHHPSSLLVRSAGKPEAWRDLVALAQAVRAGQG